jgi:hypothetical protein
MINGRATESVFRLRPWRTESDSSCILDGAVRLFFKRNRQDILEDMGASRILVG